jgi:hypothetical protein
MLNRGKLHTVIAVLALVGCNEGPAEGADEGSSGGIVSISGSSTGDTADPSSFTSAEDGSSSSSSGAFGDQLDCELIDFVFVVDNSLSMADEQQNLVDAVPGFVESIQTQLPDVDDIRVGVVDTDTYPGLGNPDPLDACPDDTDCDSCDYRLGALLTKPASARDPDSSCDFSTGEPFMNGLGESFATEFECAALVGAEGNPIEQQASALVEAVSTPMNNSCNNGFLRDDALLVFLVISDEEDDVEDPPEPQGGSFGDPSRWFDAIVKAKGGIAKNAVGLGLLGGSPRFDDCEALSEGLDGAEQTTRLSNFIQRFPTNFIGSVCSPSYNEFFTEALDAVAQGCEKFIPAG